ncbi:MAG: zinc ribbon domain-containing protein [Chloroflexota bacterium]|nr:zinc ribbon domain-containing protein [Chloroflexota bacterium]
MPIYQYQCNKCKTKFELRQSFSDKSIATCPVCHESATRIFSPVPIIFKGSGFYVTDSRAGTENRKPAKPAKSNKNK